MAERKLELTVIYGLTATEELKSIYRYNAKKRGASAADLYQDFLVAGIDRLSTNYADGKPYSEFPELRRIALKPRRSGDGHFVIYEVDESTFTVNIIHIYHTKMDVEGRLREEKSNKNA